MKHWLALLAGSILLGGIFITAQAQTPDPQTTDLQTPAPETQTVIPDAQGPVGDGQTAGTQTPGFDAEAESAALSMLLENRLKNQTDSLAPLIYDLYIDHIVYSSDGQIAAVWVGMRDKESGEIVETEPSLVIANRSSLDQSWTLTLPPEAGYSSALAALPDDVISPELRETFLESADAAAQAVDGAQSLPVFTGYLLPWAGGLSKRVTGSIGHYLIYYSCSETYCRYAYDFADGTMFPLLASKGGEVYSFYAGCSNGDTSCTNYIVLKDYSTNPVTYQVYYHLAYNTIPAALRVKGAQVQQGQYIGTADDTGYSSGHHLHFHVFTTPSSNSWGPSVDFTFDDVDTNGGRPRTCYEAANWPSLGSGCHNNGDFYLSQNYGAYPPTAALTLPSAGEVITDGNMLVAGQAWDDIGVTKAQTIVKINGVWKLVGSAQVLGGTKSESYVMDVNLCDAQAPFGSLDVAVRVWDYEGNASIDPQSMRTVTNKTLCVPDPPACQPSASQVAIYSGSNYTGSCKILGAGEYSSASAFSPVADNSLSSLLVGSNVQALLYDGVNFTDRSETIIQSDPNLADNRLGVNRVTSIRVAARTATPVSSTPTLNTPFNVTNTAITSADSLVLDWAAPGAISFQSTLDGPLSLTQDWTDSNGWSVGSLPAGDYNWTVNAKTPNGSIASSSSSFTVASASLPAANALAVPATQVEEVSGWSATSAGLWHRVDGYALDGRTVNAWVYNDGTDVGSSTVGASDLTSPPFTVPGGNVWLAFDYNTRTERDTPYWDQRWVQISVDGGRFENLLQLSGDQMDTWLSSPWIDLSPFSGKSVRLRFHFDIVDKFYNGSLPEGGVARGWTIDNVRVFSQSLPDCAESLNETAATATGIDIGAVVQGVICPAGDMDYYRFNASEGQWVTMQIQANGADLELALLDTDGRSVISSGSISSGLYVRTAGVYYLRVRAAAHPGEGGAADTYNLSTSNLTPVSQLNSLPAETNSTAVLLQWSASAASYGLDHFELQVDANNDGSWETLDGALPANARSYWFIGQPNTTYGFRIRVIDQSGTEEPFPSSAEAITHLASSCNGDVFENGDDSPSGLSAFVLNSAAQDHNLCGSNDPDWTKIPASLGQRLAVMVRAASGGAAIKISLYAPGNTSTVLASTQSAGLGQGAALEWTASAAGDYLIKIEPLRADLYGTDAVYALWVGEPERIYLPTISR
ncbi:membrane proteins related to metalloendopeptidases [Longilinea arvoryzae]|uniref:Membrane proteins related to metalloendopeptidases n=1 Tax=Longilinea arvoryzae TaxID=360412 RepID=A0A0S7BCH4_9CHLR|nr:peptidoglycan DD-metalloendopeptidase family protein [Longilinea arvoryzae]GAP12889.1 membrane proteins related to metalloendopeptidases [Longilinea arvoryzae]